MFLFSLQGQHCLGPALVPASGKKSREVASVTKMVTATVVLQLVEEGHLQLDQPGPQISPTPVGLRGESRPVWLRHFESQNKMANSSSRVTGQQQFPSHLPAKVQSSGLSPNGAQNSISFGLCRPIPKQVLEKTAVCVAVGFIPWSYARAIAFAAPLGTEVLGLCGQRRGGRQCAGWGQGEDRDLAVVCRAGEYVL